MLIRLATALATLSMISAVVDANAQVASTRPVTLVVPFPAGGPTDTIGRIIAEGLQKQLGQTVVVDNVSGATGSIGTAKVARAEADGHILILGTVATHVFNGAAYSLKYDVVTDFEPISLIAFDPQIIAIKKDLPIADLRQFISWLKANPNQAMAGTAGVGSTSHVSAVNFQAITGTTFRFIPYRGLGPAMRDLIAGHIDILFGLAANTVPQVVAGRIRGLAVTAPQRLPSAPEIPTTDEAGVRGFHFVNWHGLWAPRGTPTDVVARLNAAIRNILADQAILKRLGDIGQQIPPAVRQTPEALAAYQKDEISKWWPVIKAADIRGE